ncbi:MAG: hypothetical protein R8G66_02025 [Cytophagales bacterium]|nr:hypothetical protein [Cytophagales bacterium]
MKKLIIITTLILCLQERSTGQIIPIDTTNWQIFARSYILENFRGQDAIYLQGGSIVLKDTEFLNGIIEYDIFLKEEQAFPGIYFRSDFDKGTAEHFYIRPHLSGKPDGNQAIPTIQNITAWQLYFGQRYSFPYEYKYDDWTHVKILVNGDKAQVFLDYSEAPHLSWDLFLPAKKGGISLSGGNRSGMHIANVKVSHEAPEIKDFAPIKRKPIEGVFPNWEISDMFEEKLLEDPNKVDQVLNGRKWQGKIEIDEGTAANISRIQNLRDGTPGNTVLARVIIQSDRDQIKLLEFGYSDRVVAILNGKSIYRGNNGYRSRDYRYLGTIGLFDGIYLDLKKGRNELILAVSENFGGWLVTGRIQDMQSITIK